MSLGNVPRRNLSGEDKTIQARLRLYDALLSRYQLLGFEYEIARAQSMKDVLSCNKKQVMTALKNLEVQP